MAAVSETVTVGGNVQAPLNYIIDNGEKPAINIGTPKEGMPRRSNEFEAKTVTIADGRAVADRLSLEREGFQLFADTTAVTDFFNDQEVQSVYYREVEQLVKRVTGATAVKIFDHTIRVEDEGKRDAKDVRAPVPVIHNDYTELSGPQRVRDLLEPEEAEVFLKHRFAEINVWRSIGAPAQTTPLAVADSQSLAAGDLIASDLVYDDRVGEIYQIAFNPEHRWYYFPDMHKNEALLLKCYDSEKDGRARFSAHSAFKNPNASADAPPRESIEVRTLVSFAPPMD